MSKELLYNLNGPNKGPFRKFIDSRVCNPRIAWYPSAGSDFRALFYLNARYSRHNPGSEPDPPSPDIFLFTDYHPWHSLNFLIDPVLYADAYTTVIVQELEWLPNLCLTRNQEIVDYPEGGQITDRCAFLWITVESNVFGSITTPVIYAFAENESFFAHKLVQNHAVASHIVHIRYGGGLGGGGKCSGGWLLNVLTRLNCELFITDGMLQLQHGDQWAMEHYRVKPKHNIAKLRRIRKIKSHMWSNHGDISWFKVS